MQYERVWVYSAHKLGFIPIILIGCIAIGTGGGPTAFGITAAGLALGTLGLRPIRLALSPSSGAVTISTVLSRKRFEFSRQGEYVFVYAHRAGFLRGTANLALVKGSKCDWVPATNGTMFWRRPELPAAPLHRAFRICGTRSFLALVTERTGGSIDLTGALRMGT